MFVLAKKHKEMSCAKLNRLKSTNIIWQMFELQIPKRAKNHWTNLCSKEDWSTTFIARHFTPKLVIKCFSNANLQLFTSAGNLSVTENEANNTQMSAKMNFMLIFIATLARAVGNLNDFFICFLNRVWVLSHFRDFMKTVKHETVRNFFWKVIKPWNNCEVSKK